MDYEEGIQITPFNMRDELEEGHFDSEGTFIFEKDKVYNYIVCKIKVSFVVA